MNLICYLCGSDDIKTVKGRVRDNKSLSVVKCDVCGLIFLSSFDHIQENYYDDSHQHDDPLEYRTAIEYGHDDNRRFEYCKLSIENKKLLDFGCGEGGFLSKAQDLNGEFDGFELETSSRNYLREKGIKVFSSFENMKGHEGYYDVITIFHVLEHCPDPISLIEELKKYLNPDGGQILIEVPNGDDALIKLYNNKGFSNFYWSCHLFLFTRRTLTDLLHKANCNIEYIKQIQRYSLSNHLYWLANNEHGGHLKWGFMDSDLINSEYANNLGSLGMCDTLIGKVIMK